MNTARRSVDDQASSRRAPSPTCGGQSTAPQPVRRSRTDRVLDQLDMEAAIGCGWWETDSAGLIVGFSTAGPVASVFVAIARLLCDGEDPEVIVGDTTAAAAFAVAQEWLDAGIEPDAVAGWLRAGCWKPAAASALVEAGLRPWRLLDENRQPRYWVEVDTPEGEPLPLARAVAEDFIIVDTAVQVVTRRAS